MNTHEFTVYVTKPSGRKYLYLRWKDQRGKWCQRSARTTRKSEAGKLALALQDRLTKELRLEQIGWDSIRLRFERDHVAFTDKRTQTSYATALNRFEDTVAPRTSADIDDGILARFVQGCMDDQLSPTTIRSYLRHLKPLWRLCIRWGVLQSMPETKVPKVTKSAKGRPLTLEEFERYLAAVDRVIGFHRLQWEFDIRLLWLTGLRLGEAHQLWWPGDGNGMQIEVRGIDRQRPMLWIPAGLDKSRRESTTPLTPDAVEFLRTVPESERTGHVCHFIGAKGKRLSSVDNISKLLGNVGKAANVVTAANHRGEPVYASAHDLRRSFGNRWATRVQSAVLQKMMRHRSIQTTITFYANVAAIQTSDAIYEAYEGEDIDVSNGDDRWTDGREPTRSGGEVNDPNIRHGR